MKKQFISLVVAVMASVLFSGCKSLPDEYKTGHFIFKMMPKNGSENFKKGWVDGCKSGLANMTNSMYRSFYEFTQDRSLIKNAEYYRTWGDTFHFCRHYAYGILRQGNDRMRLQNNIPTLMEAVGGGHNMLEHGLGQMAGPATWGLMFENWGQTQGSKFFTESLDWDDNADMAMNGKGHGFGSNMTWDFTPTHSIAPY